eukprot:228171-Hanusia_phi.AAC.2
MKTCPHCARAKKALEAILVSAVCSNLTCSICIRLADMNSMTFQSLTIRRNVQADCEPEILNNIRVWNNRVDDPLITVRECKKKVIERNLVVRLTMSVVLGSSVKIYRFGWTYRLCRNFEGFRFLGAIIRLDPTGIDFRSEIC